MFQGSFKGVSREFQGSFTDVSRKFQRNIEFFGGSFKGVSRKFGVYFKEVRILKQVTKVFQGCFKGFQGRLKKIETGL